MKLPTDFLNTTIIHRKACNLVPVIGYCMPYLFFFLYSDLAQNMQFVFL